MATPAAVPDAFASTQKPTTSQSQTSTAAVTPVAPPTGPASTVSQPPQAPSSNQNYGRFPQATSHEPAGFPQKPYDTFAQQPTTTSSFDSFPAATSQAPGPQTSGAFSSGPNDYSSYYTADQQSRNAYGGYYGYQQGGQSHGEPNATNRPFGAYNASQTDNLSQYPQSAAQQSRYPGSTNADAHNSGHNTPNPVGQNQQQASAQGAQPQSNMQQQQSSYPYPQHPYYTNPYYSQYMSHQPYGGYSQGGYGGGPYGKGGIYGQAHHQYGMSPQGPFDHASTANTAGFGQSSVGSRDSGLTSGINDFSRSSTSQQSGAPGALGSGGFGGVHDSYARGAGFPSQGSQGFNASNAPTTTPGSGNDELKPYGDSKTGGPSPSLASAARPGSTNATPAASGLPPPQSTQQGMGAYGSYSSHLSQNLHGGQPGTSGYGLGGASNQGHGNNPYGGYGNQGFGNYYGGRQGHQGGWGGNYH
ncbi:hypothetical protein NPX13_g4400 [Xylaria arbuscula]|uniref:Uncharacterized protein n=1 Tax=Xylaria arbuscula TaxID=114810 RepID=A0A9W8NGK0_9PEZI|nr:hypothetical protein NPX13_g4400 [Xylaria arbuscula]